MSRAKENAELASKIRAGIGGIVTSDADSLETVAVGTDGQVLTADSSEPNGIKWATPGASGLSAPQITDLTDGGESTLHYHASDRDLANATGSLSVSKGGTGATLAQTAINTLTAVSGATVGDVLTKSGTNAVWLAPSGAGIGDVSGPASAVDANLPSFNGTGGKTLQDSGIAASNVATLTGTQTLINKTIGSGSGWNGNAIATTFGGTGQTTVAKGDVLFASATNVISKLPIGTNGQTLTVNASGVPSWTTSGNFTFEFVVDGAFGNGVTDASAEIQAKINLAQAAGGGNVIIPQGTYIINATLVIPSWVTLEGQGVDTTKLKLKNSANQSVITTTSTSSLIGGTSAGGAKYWGIKNLTIDGNRTNNTSGHGIYTYSRTYFIDQVKIMGCKQYGIYSQWSATAAAWDDDSTDMFMEPLINSAYIMDCGQHGLYYDGPHDGRVTGVISALNGRTTVGTYDGIYVGSRSGGTQFDKCHSWGDTQKYAYNVNSNYIYFTNCVADDARTALVYVNGTHFSWVGGHAFGAIWNNPPLAHDLTMKGFLLGSSCWHPHIDTLCSNAPGGAIDFTSAGGGSGTIILNGDILSALNVYGTTYGYIGTPPAGWNVQINIFTPENNASYYSTSGSSGGGTSGESLVVGYTNASVYTGYNGVRAAPDGQGSWLSLTPTNNEAAMELNIYNSGAQGIAISNGAGTLTRTDTGNSTPFTSSWVGKRITFAGAVYTVVSVPSSSSMTITPSAPSGTDSYHIAYHKAFGTCNTSWNGSVTTITKVSGDPFFPNFDASFKCWINGTQRTITYVSPTTLTCTTNLGTLTGASFSLEITINDQLSTVRVQKMIGNNEENLSIFAKGDGYHIRSFKAGYGKERPIWIGHTSTATKFDTDGSIYVGQHKVNFQPTTTASLPTWTEGDVYYDSGLHKLRCFNGTSWFDLF